MKDEIRPDVFEYLRHQDTVWSRGYGYDYELHDNAIARADWEAKNEVGRRKKRISPWYGQTLFPSDVSEIRKRYSAGEYTIIELAETYCVSKVTISRIINFKTWKNLGNLK